MLPIVKLQFEKLHEDAVIPTYAHNTDSGFDLYALHDAIIYGGEVTPIKTGIAARAYFDRDRRAFGGLKEDVIDILIDLMSLEIQIRPKSGLALKHGITIVNTPATIDQNYTGDLTILATRIYNEQRSVFPYIVIKGQKIAQGIVCPVFAGCNVQITEGKLPNTDRNSNGFGSTGV